MLSAKFGGQIALLALLHAAPVAAQSLHGALEWLPAGSLNVQELTSRPAEAMAGGNGQSFYVEYGRLAFRSPDVLGGNARKAGLSCQGCHPNGHANRHFFIPRLSDRPGRIDVTNALWSARAEDHRDNALTIPSLRGVKDKSRLGHDHRSGSLREFTRNVIVLEFDGAEPEPLLLDALIAYQQTLRPSQAPDVAVTFQGDLADLARALRVLRLPLAEENVPLSGRVATMLRGQIGFIHERFETPPPRQVLEGWSQALKSIAELAETGQWPQARDRLDRLQKTVAAPPPVLTASAPTSLYDQGRLRSWLSMPTR